MPELDLLYKPDAAQAAAHVEAYWHKAIIDRAPILLTAPNSNPHPLPKRAHATLRERWLNVETVVTTGAVTVANTYWAGDGLPMWWPNLGPELLSACMGTPLTFGESTSWSTPTLHDWSDLSNLQIDHNNEYTRTLLAMLRLGLEMGKGKFVVGITDIHPGADLAASFRDPQQLCVDLVDAPERVHELNRQIYWAFFEFYEMQRRIMLDAGQSLTTGWAPLYCTNGRYYIPSCDFSILVSTGMFREFFLPEILAEIAWLDRSLYHLDGPGALRHLDTLLDIPKLDGIQFVYGDGAKPATRWIKIYQKIQDAGKTLHIFVDPREVDFFIEHLKPEGVMLQSEARSVEEADAILAKVARWTKRQS